MKAKEMHEPHQMHHEKKEITMQQYIILGLVALLLVFSVVQAFQISSIKSSLSAGAITPSVASSAGNSPSSSPRSPAPAMIGGC